MADEQWLTVAEVAGRLRVNPETVRRYLRDGKIKGQMFGGRKAGWRISHRALDAFLKDTGENETAA